MTRCEEVLAPGQRVLDGEAPTASRCREAAAPIVRAGNGATEAASCSDFGWVSGILPPPPARVLDAGCGDGALSAWLAHAGYAVTSIDADPAAVTAARSAGVPAVRADLTTYDDEPYDAVVMLLSMHHMHPLRTVADRVARLLRPGGVLILDEFAWDWANDATIRWFFDIGAILSAAGVIDPLPEGDSPLTRWRTRHTVDDGLCNTGDAMIGAVSARLGDVSVRRVPYLARHLLAGRGTSQLLAELCRVEREHLADGTLSATGFRLTARRTAGNTTARTGNTTAPAGNTTAPAGNTTARTTARTG